MANLVPKRQNLATNMVIEGTNLVNALVALQELQKEYAQCGTFLDSDFTGTALQQLSASLVNAIFAATGVVDSLSSWYSNNTAIGNAGIGNQQNLLQIRS